MPSSSASVLVIGGGVVGRACALALQRDGWQVTLMDPDMGGHAASWGNAGHIATEQVAPLASLAALRSVPRQWHAFGGALDLRNPLQLLPWVMGYLRACAPRRYAAGCVAMQGLLAEALPAWRRLVDAIHTPELLQESGHWVCWESKGSAHRGERAWRAAATGTASASALSDAQRARLQGELAVPIYGGLAFDGTAQIKTLPLLAKQLADSFMRAGGLIHSAQVHALRCEGRRVHAITAGGGRMDADLIMVCAGVRSRELMAMLGMRAPLVAERGYHLQWAAHEWPSLPPVVFEDRSMIVTRFEEGLRAASFVEYAGTDASPDPRKWTRLQQHVAELGLPVRGDPVPWFGARPTLPDYLPALGRSARFDNIAYAFGHQHLGLTLAAVTGELMAAMCAGRPSAVSCASFDVERFA